MSNIPTKFTGLHSHSTMGSVFDATGSPQEHIDFVLKNGGDSLALTDHGNMNGYAYQYLHAQKLKKAGVPWKSIYGAEVYHIPSLVKWKELYEKAKESGELSKRKKKVDKVIEEHLGDEMASTLAEVETIADIKRESDDQESTPSTPSGDATPDADDSGGTIIENEEESKTNKYKNPIYQRNHLVLLAKNDAGLKSLFRIISDSAADGFYRYPRVDLDSLRKHANGNIIATSACLSGDSRLETSHGLLMIKEVCNLLQKGEDIFCLSFSESEQRIKFSKILNGKLTKKNAKVIKITLSNGKSLKLTTDHKVYTNKGWVEAGELKKLPGIKVLSIS